ncbi:MAG TPA: glycosyltransferase family 2 protein [Actinocrinis sp.]|nr:glycosyltransferase family 2 protein [Actinocrinis sp.]
MDQNPDPDPDSDSGAGSGSGAAPARPPAGGLRGRVKRAARRHIGWIPPYELRNKIRLGHTAPALRRFENAEVSRLRPTLPGDRSALVTTVIPTYRRPEHLLAAVRSALAQTVDGQPADQFVLVVDDGGGLPELPADPRLAAVSLHRNAGVAGVVRNVGIRLARSEFVAFLDDDNRWEPNHLETALAALRGRSDDPHDRSARPYGVYTALLRVLPDGTEAGLLSEPFDRRKARVRSFLDTNTFVVRRGRAVRFSRLRRSREVMPREDWELIYRLSRRRRIAHVPRQTVRYLVNPDTYFTNWDTTFDNHAEEWGLPT